MDKYLEYKNCSFYWNPLFIKQLNEWELELMASILDDIYALKLRNGGKIISSSSLQNLKAFNWRHYKVLRGCWKSLPWQNIWKLQLPPMVAFYFWGMALEKKLSIDNLGRQRLIIMSQGESGCSSFSSLCYGFGVVVFDFLSVWSLLANSLFSLSMVVHIQKKKVLFLKILYDWPWLLIHTNILLTF